MAEGDRGNQDAPEPGQQRSEPSGWARRRRGWLKWLWLLPVLLLAAYVWWRMHQPPEVEVVHPQERMALRHLLSGGSQTLLILAGVAMAVTLVIFVSGLITGLQRRLIDTIVGSAPHVTLEAPERIPRVPAKLPGYENALVVATRQQRLWQPETIDQCKCLEADVATFDHVTAVAPSVTGQALITRAGTEKSVRVVGSPPRQQDLISNLSEDMVRGSYLNLRGDEAVIGYALAEELGVEMGDRVRLTTGIGARPTASRASFSPTRRESISPPSSSRSGRGRRCSAPARL